jgi:hypothetical protein
MSNGQHSVKGLEHLRRVAARALDEDAFRQQLMAHPARVLKQEGITVRDGVSVEIHQNTAQRVHLVLPTGIVDAQELSSNETDISVLGRTGMHV